MQPFEGLDILDLTQSIAGPVSTQFLGTMGANVIKLEPPDGDAFRDVLDGAMFLSVNLGGKRSISFDLKTDQGRELFESLLTESDVMVTSFRPEVLDRLEIDYESATDINDDLVYLSLTGFGHDGPYSDRPAYDPVIQAMSGLMSTIGYNDRAPARIGASVIDWGTGTTAAFLIASALQHRRQTGESVFIDVNLFEVAVAWMSYWVAHYSTTNDVPDRHGDGFAGLAPYGVFHANGEKPFYLSVVNDRFFQRLCQFLDREDLLKDDRFTTKPARWDHRDTLREELEEEFRQYDRAELCERLAEHGVPSGPLQTVDQLVEDDPHLSDRNLLVDSYNVNTEEPATTIGPPFTIENDRPDVETEPPELGEHTREILQELGYDEAQINDLLKSDAVFAPDT